MEETREQMTNEKSRAQYGDGETRKHVVRSKKIIITASDDNDIWNADWIIALLGDDGEAGEEIGKISFAGDKVLGTVPLHVEIKEAYQSKGYGTEAIALMTAWAFHFRNIYEVSADTDRENDKAVRALKRNGFVYRDFEGRVEHYSLTRPKTAWTGLYLFIGIFLGLILGIVLSHVVTGLIVGIVIGVPIGLSLDMKANKEREKITGKKIR